RAKSAIAPRPSRATFRCVEWQTSGLFLALVSAEGREHDEERADTGAHRWRRSGRIIRGGVRCPIRAGRDCARAQLPRCATGTYDAAPPKFDASFGRARTGSAPAPRGPIAGTA